MAGIIRQRLPEAGCQSVARKRGASTETVALFRAGVGLLAIRGALKILAVLYPRVEHVLSSSNKQYDHLWPAQ